MIITTSDNIEEWVYRIIYGSSILIIDSKYNNIQDYVNNVMIRYLKNPVLREEAPIFSTPLLDEIVHWKDGGIYIKFFRESGIDLFGDIDPQFDYETNEYFRILPFLISDWFCVLPEEIRETAKRFSRHSGMKLKTHFILFNMELYSVTEQSRFKEYAQAIAYINKLAFTSAHISFISFKEFNFISQDEQDRIKDMAQKIGIIRDPFTLELLKY